MISPAAGPASTWNNGPGQVAFLGRLFLGLDTWFVLRIYLSNGGPTACFETTYPVFSQTSTVQVCNKMQNYLPSKKFIKFFPLLSWEQF